MVWLLEIMTASICVDDISRLPILHELSCLSRQVAFLQAHTPA